MRLAALITGLVGAVAGFVGAIVALVAGGIAGALEVQEGATVAALGLAALLASVVGLVGASLSMTRPRAAAGLMVLSAVVGVFTISVAYALATVLLLIAAILAFLGRREADRRPASLKPAGGIYCGDCGQQLGVGAAFCGRYGAAQG